VAGVSRFIDGCSGHVAEAAPPLVFSVRMPAVRNSLTHLPNAISIARIIIAPVALWSAWEGYEGVYKGLFTVAVVSDFLDGAIARMLRIESDLGARLDAFADMLTYLVCFFAVGWLWPGFIFDRMWLIAFVLIAYAISFGIGFLRFRRLNAFHSLAGKISAVLVAGGLIVWFIGGPGWVFTAALAFSLLSALEQIVIASVIPSWRVEVPTVWHAINLRRTGNAPST
jgi:CDP-diacylglycerol--glycerol-3-phosphate 3-phosphatidyltransferase